MKFPTLFVFSIVTILISSLSFADIQTATPIKQVAAKSAKHHAIANKHSFAINKKISKAELKVAVAKARASLEHIAAAMSTHSNKTPSRQETKIAMARLNGALQVAMRQERSNTLASKS